MVDIVKRLSRVELAFTDGQLSGAQATIESGFVDPDSGVFRRSEERTTGIDAGTHPEYSLPLADVLGEALTQALATIEARDAALAERDATIEALTADNQG
jgi:hypothetical protein